MAKKKKDPLANLDGPKYIIEIQESEEKNEETNEYEYGWLLSVGEYLDYECECNHGEAMEYGPVFKTFHEAIRAGIKAIDEGVGPDTPFELRLIKELSERLR